MNGNLNGNLSDDLSGDLSGNRRRAGQVVRVLLVCAGLAALGYGLAGLVTHPRPVNLPNSTRWLAGGVLVHDLVLVPATVLVGLVLARFVPAPYRAVAQGALIVSASVALMCLPLWLGYGGTPGNPTTNPLPYRRNLALVLGAVWAAAAAIMILRAVRRRRRHRRHRRHRLPGDPARGRRISGGEGKLDDEPAAAVDVVDGHAAAVCLDDAAHDRQPET
ncbi:hypothetical protein [Parafrankia sp. FMc2]|uniref:hypothetical protein n=1 Tax=Parafrankia sp. FMc2 TaxID=3233196 RepID=UPI0034D41740